MQRLSADVQPRLKHRADCHRPLVRLQEQSSPPDGKSHRIWRCLFQNDAGEQFAVVVYLKAVWIASTRMPTRSAAVVSEYEIHQLLQSTRSRWAQPKRCRKT